MTAIKGPRVQRRKVNTGEAVTVSLLNEISTEAQTSALDGILGLLLSTPSGTTPLFSGGFIGNGFRATRSGGARTVVFKAGAALFSREADGGLDPTQAAYSNLPMMIPFYNLLGTTSVTVDAHDATNPRYDVITVKPVETDEDSDDIRERVSSPGSQQVVARYRRARWYPQFTVTKGTPAGSPTVPSPPSDELVVAYVLVPASSGNVTIYDKRNLLTVSQTVSQAPPSGFANACVVSGLTVSHTSGLGISVADGTALVGAGRVREFTGTTATLTSDPSDPVIYLIEASNADGTILVTRGTPASTPTEPAITGVPLAYITVAAAATSLGASAIESLATRGPYTGAMAEIPTAHLNVTVGALSGADRQFTIQAVDWSGNNIAARVVFEFQVGVAGGSAGPEPADNASGTLTDAVVTGNRILPLGTNGCGVFKTDTAGLAVLTITAGSPWAGYITVKPVSYLDASATGSSATMARQAYRPGGPTIVLAAWV